MALPGKSATYKGPVTDTDRWEKFQYRPDDIFICTPPKCGTTWTQALVAMVIFEGADHGEKPGVISPWIDADLAPLDEYLRLVDNQTHRRFIKTHTPLDGIPHHNECQYLVVMRDPRDALFSMMNHQDNMSNEEIAATLLTRDGHEIDHWIDGSLDPTYFDHQTIETHTHFLKTYWDYRDLPNVHLLHYYDLKQDLRGHIAKLGDILDVSLDGQQLDEMTDAGTFENMQKKGDQYAPAAGTGLWKHENSFFATGKNSQWREKMTEEQLNRLDARVNQLLSEAQKAWLFRS
ncbi:MAG: sulfotransferase domain-containing protein [Pseudomonadales bacterium]|nr:sulfotransferase domain-containing protein [Pseudomonadales bacterium]MBO7005056.1 sulfotransferase domain-containing protein [Pseudomonadales bacterium]